MKLQRLSAIRTEMQALAQFEPPAIGWDRIRETIPQRHDSLSPRRVGLAGAAAAAITIAVIALIARHRDRRSVDESPTVAGANDSAVQPDVRHVDKLVAQSAAPGEAAAEPAGAAKLGHYFGTEKGLLVGGADG